MAEPEILPRFRRCAVKRKPDGSEVTEADVAAERAMRQAIAQRFPDHAVLGEEDGASGPELAEFRWILDPIDGTASFVLGLPLFGTLVALLREDVPVVGVMHFPALGETVWAAQGQGCWFRANDGTEARVHVRPPTVLARASVSTTGIHGSDLRNGAGIRWRLGAVMSAAGTFRFVGDCYQHALVCRGVLDAAIDTEMEPWDSAALISCVEEAGGLTSTLGGERVGAYAGGSLLSSSGSELHDEIVRALRPDG